MIGMYDEFVYRQERYPARVCRECGGALFSGEIYYDIGGRAICRDCLPLLARRLFRRCRRAAGEEDVR